MTRRPDAPAPPRLLRALLEWSLPRDERRHLLREMDELYARRRHRDGRLRADLWYLRHGAAFPVRLLLDDVGRVLRRAASLPDSLLRDARYGTRALLRRPAYTVPAILTLGVGIGGVATVFNAANWVLLRPVPGVEARAGLVTLRMEMGSGGSPAFPVSAPDVRTLAERTPSLEELAAAIQGDLHFALGQGEPRRISGAVVTANLFRVLRTAPRAGRFFDPAAPFDARDGRGRHAVISHRLWQDAWGGSPAALGSTVRLNGEPFTVIGIAPPGFHGPELPGRTDIWLPPGAVPVLDPSRPPDVLSRRGTAVFTDLVGRLAPGGDPARVELETMTAMEAIRDEFRGGHSFAANFTFRAYPGIGLSPRVRAAVRKTLWLLAAAATLLLFLSVVNVGTLGVAHWAARSGTSAVHRALGATPLSLVRRVLVEHGILGTAGAAAGLALALVGTRLFADASLSPFGASLEGMRLDGRVATFTVAVSLGASLLAGAFPAVRAAGDRLLEDLRVHRHGSRGIRRLQAGMIVAQVALSGILLVGAALFVRTAANLRAGDPTFDARAVLRFAIDPELQGYDSARTSRMVHDLEEALLREPTVRSVGFASPAPIVPSQLTIHFWPEGGDPEEDRVVGGQHRVTAGFLDALNARLLGGRGFTTAETEGGGAEPVVVATERLARALFPGLPPEAAVGRRILRQTWNPSGRITYRIVGVVEDPRFRGARLEDFPVVFLPWSRGPDAGAAVGWVRYDEPPADGASRIRAVVRRADPALPVFDLRTVRAQLDRLIVEERVVARLILTLAAMGLLLAGIGLHGVLGHAVTTRRKEIGIRTALGATPGALALSLVSRALLLATVGALLGVAGAVPLARLVESRLFGVDPLDPAAYAAGVAVLLTAASLAAWAPARRAIGLHPREVLAEE